MANGCQTIAFPAISTGIYRYPKEDAARIAVGTVADFLQQDAPLAEIIFACFDEDMAALYRAAITDLRRG